VVPRYRCTRDGLARTWEGLTHGKHQGLGERARDEPQPDWQAVGKTGVDHCEPGGRRLNLETAVDRFLALESPYELQLLCARARSPQG